jgi:purine-binding chemotaxis protein CheW
MRIMSAKDAGESQNVPGMNEKIGRKALLKGMPCRPAGPEPAGSAPGDETVLSDLESVLDRGIRGEFPGTIDESAIGEKWKPLVHKVNDLTRKLEEENNEILRLRNVEDMAKQRGSAAANHESQLSDLTLIRESIIRKNPLPLILLDSSGTITDANEAFSRMSGLSPEALKSMHYKDFTVLSAQGGGVEDVLKFKRHSVSEVSIDFPSGTHVFEQYSIPMTGKDGAVQGLLVIFHDKTQVRCEEEQLKNKISELEVRLVEEEKKAARSVSTDTPAAAVSSPVLSPDSVTEVPKTGKDTSDAGIPETKPDQEVSESEKELQKSRLIDVVEFELCGQRYALDINVAREIVEMMPITPIPSSPRYLRGIMNLRGEITNIIDINTLLGLTTETGKSGNKIIVLSSDATGGENIGIIVDDVQSVMQVQESDIEQLGEGLSTESASYIKGIIKIGGKGGDKKGKGSKERDLILWIDVLRVIEALSAQKGK